MRSHVGLNERLGKNAVRNKAFPGGIRSEGSRRPGDHVKQYNVQSVGTRFPVENVVKESAH